MVRALVSPSTGAEEHDAVVRALGVSMRSPNEIISCLTIPEDHYLKAQAYAVRDAFEAVTNGMTDPEAMAAIYALPPDSVFAPWKGLVLAIEAFYAGNRPARDEHTASIPADSFPARIASIWKDLDAREAGLLPSGAGSALADAVYPPSEGLGLMIEEIRESLDEGLEEYFLAAAARFLREISALSQEAAERAALGILSEIDARGAAPESFLRLMRQLFGEAEGLRLTALYLSESRPALALLFWLKAACTALSGGVDRRELGSWLLAMAGTAESARRQGSAGDLAPALGPLVDRLFALAGEQPPSTHDPLDRLEALRAACIPSKGSGAPFTRGNGAPDVALAGRRGRGRHRSQLELFMEHGP